jgi:hypothetical protein
MALTPEQYNKVKALLSSEDGKLYQAYLDQRITEGIKKAQTNVAILPNAVERLKAIEDAASKKVSELEMKNKVLRACFEKGISFESVEKLGLVFNDESEIEKKLGILGKDVELKKNKDLNELLASMPKPQSGQQYESPTTPLEKWKAKLPADEQIALEKFEHKKKWFR